jgi:hypothetical protein
MQLCLDRRRDGGLGSGPSRRVPMGHPLRVLVFPTRRDVPWVAHPGRGVRLGLGCRTVIRRADQPRGWWQPVGGGAPPAPCRGAIAWLHPDAPPGLDGWDLTPPAWCRRSVQGVQQAIPEPRFRLTRHATRATRAQPGAVNAGIGALAPQGAKAAWAPQAASSAPGPRGAGHRGIVALLVSGCDSGHTPTGEPRAGPVASAAPPPC